MGVGVHGFSVGVYHDQWEGGGFTLCFLCAIFMYLLLLFFFYNLHNSPSKQKPRANTGIMPELENLADSNAQQQQQQQPEGAGGRPRMSESVSEERSASRSPSIGE